MPKVTHIQIQMLEDARAMVSFQKILYQSFSLVWDLFNKYKVFVKLMQLVSNLCAESRSPSQSCVFVQPNLSHALGPCKYVKH